MKSQDPQPDVDHFAKEASGRLRVGIDVQVDLPASDRFAAEAARPATGIVREMWAFLRANKKWWLTPIVVVLVLVGTLSMLAASGLAPLIYTLF